MRFWKIGHSFYILTISIDQNRNHYGRRIVEIVIRREVEEILRVIIKLQNIGNAQIGISVGEVYVRVELDRRIIRLYEIFVLLIPERDGDRNWEWK